MNTFIETLKNKYNYDEKTINALQKIIPALIEYYGIEYQQIIYESIEQTKIICCNSFQTISKIINEETRTKTIKNELKQENDIEDKEGTYFSSVIIEYNELKNKYEIKNINRKIIIAHTFNLDSPKGLEVLIMNLCRLIKSYINEYEIKDNKLFKKEGLYKEIYKISINENKPQLYLIDNCALGFNLGSNLYDTEQIESLILKDQYKTYYYESVKSIISLLKNNFNLKDNINQSEIEGTNCFKEKYDKKDDIYEELLNLLDKCLNLEHEMIVLTYSSREEKNKIKEQINSIIYNDIANNLLKYKISDKKEQIKKSQNS